MLAEKIQMTQIFNEEGDIIPATVLRVRPVVVLQVKTKEKDGYEAVQVGSGEKKIKNIKKPQRGHFKGLGNFSVSREFRMKNPKNVGDKMDLSNFKEGEKVVVRGVSKGKGFQGVVKRHNFAGGPRTHGQKHNERAPGSIGATWPQRVLKGKRMAGRMGGENVTVKNLKIVKIETEKNLIYLSGATPGARGALIEIKSAN